MNAVPRLADLTRDLDVERRATDYVKCLSCLHATRGVSVAAAKLFDDRWPLSLSTEIVRRSVLHKAATAPGTTTDATWAGPLAPVSLVEGFVALARSASLLGRIPGLRMVPFRAHVPTQTGGGSYAWTGQGAPKPITKLTFGDIVLDPLKAMGIIVVTDELARLVLPGTETALRDTLIAGLTAFTDTAFLDPTVAAVAGVSPASITNGTTPATAGSDVRTSVDALLKAFFAARPGADDAVLVMSAGTRARLVGPYGTGESYAGLPIVATGAAAANVVVLDPHGVCVADNGVAIDVSGEAAIQMDSAPMNPPDATVVFTDLWSHDLAGFRVERFVNWQAVAGAVMYVVVP